MQSDVQGADAALRNTITADAYGRAEKSDSSTDTHKARHITAADATKSIPPSRFEELAQFLKCHITTEAPLNKLNDASRAI